MKMTALKSQESDINRFNAMSDQEFAAWCADKRRSVSCAFLSVHLYSLMLSRRTRQDNGQPAASYPQMGGKQAGPSSQPPQPPPSMLSNVQQQPPAQVSTPQIRPQVPPSPANHPPRSGATPFPFGANAQTFPQTSPSMQPQLPMPLPNGVRPGARPFAFPTMGVDMFRRAHNTYCQRNNIVVDQSLLQFEGRPIELHALHTEVLGHGGYTRV